MREQDNFKVDRFWSGPFEKRLPDKKLATIRIATSVVVLALLSIGMLAAPAVSSARVDVGISVAFAPPALPIYIQPPCPGPNYIWTPGYWAWDPDIGYYWVPGTWVLAPFLGALWTPGYWGWSDGVFVWFAGYWALEVGFYGGINYGFGYTGYGYHGGYWDHGSFYYNRSVNNVNVTNITNVYNKTVSSPVTRSRVSYNGGRGGTTVRPSAAQLAVASERHSAPTDVQLHNERAARIDPRQRAAVNHGRPAVAATPKPGMFSGSGVVRASRAGAPYKAAPSGKMASPSAHARPSHPAAGNEGSPRVAAPEHVKRPAHEERPATTGGNERSPRVAAPEHVKRPAHEERHATTGSIERSPRVAAPEHVRPPTHEERHATTGSIERSPRAAAPEHVRPPAHEERYAAPRNEPARPVYKAQRGSQHNEKPKCC